MQRVATVSTLDENHELEGLKIIGLLYVKIRLYFFLSNPYRLIVCHVFLTNLNAFQTKCFTKLKDVKFKNTSDVKP